MSRVDELIGEFNRTAPTYRELAERLARAETARCDLQDAVVSALKQRDEAIAERDRLAARLDAIHHNDLGLVGVSIPEPENALTDSERIDRLERALLFMIPPRRAYCFCEFLMDNDQNFLTHAHDCPLGDLARDVAEGKP